MPRNRGMSTSFPVRKQKAFPVHDSPAVKVSHTRNNPFKLTGLTASPWMVSDLRRELANRGREFDATEVLITFSGDDCEFSFMGEASFQVLPETIVGN